ncbi:MAG: triphosphoribosyl-dephospho-CoA synthase, partial [Nitrosomonadales bacterium]|nr:triphosphoribosyl-dephospho-CoA synthase [Nitrosomonadales bacterium]
ADSHVSRKYGLQVAELLTKQAIPHKDAFFMCENPKTYMAELLKWDADLKSQAINPGTTADLTVATLLLYEFLNKLEINSNEAS